MYMLTFNVTLLSLAQTDMDQTVATIVRNSSQPLSIVIVGVGGADFSSMNRLDGDGGRLKDSSGKVAGT